MEQCQNVNDFINSNVFAKMSKDPVTWHLLLTNVQISRRGVRLPYDAQPLGRLKWFRVLVTRHVTAFWPWTDETCVIEYMRPSLSNHLQAFAFIVLCFFFFPNKPCCQFANRTGDVRSLGSSHWNTLLDPHISKPSDNSTCAKGYSRQA